MLDLKLPVDTLVECEGLVRYYKGNNGQCVEYTHDGKTSKTSKTTGISLFRDSNILENPWMVHHGGECPVSGWVKIEVVLLQDEEKDKYQVTAGVVTWVGFLVVYRILEQEIKI
jgi:hypothetical protein